MIGHRFSHQTRQGETSGNKFATNLHGCSFRVYLVGSKIRTRSRNARQTTIIINTSKQIFCTVGKIDMIRVIMDIANITTLDTLRTVSSNTNILTIMILLRKFALDSLHPGHKRE